MIARKRVEVFKPSIDTRYSDDEIVSHGDLRMHSQVVANAGEITERIDWRSEVVGIDEANFMGPQLVDVAQRLADSGKQVIVAGLDTDYLAGPSAHPDLLALSDPSPRRSPFACAAATRPSTRSGCAVPTS